MGAGQMDIKKFLVLILCLMLLVSCSSEQLKSDIVEEPREGRKGDIVEEPRGGLKGDIVEEPSKLEALPSTDLDRPEKLQIGVNFIRFYWSEDNSQSETGSFDTPSDYVQPEAIFEDFSKLGINTFRQFIKADFLWNIIESQDNQWDFSQADNVVTNPDFEPIVTLFAIQYASPTPPWTESNKDFQKTLGLEAKDYIETLIDRYGDYVTYWELGNEMSHWVAAENPPEDSSLPFYYPLDGFSPQEQGFFLRQVSEFIKGRDPDAVIVLPGMGGIGAHSLDFWLEGVIEGAGGTDWFDIVNYHFYGGWESFTKQRQQFDQKLVELSIDDKPVWLTETGSTSSETLTLRTDYPNSEESQCADVFRRIIQAYGYGDDLVFWHTYIGSSGEENDWRDYGLRSPVGEFRKTYYTFKLLIHELIPFESVELIFSDPQGKNVYLITTDEGDEKYVVWGTGGYEVAEGITKMTSVIPNEGNNFDWEDVNKGDTIELTEVPVLMQ